jgi:hypothetical protein
VEFGGHRLTDDAPRGRELTPIKGVLPPWRMIFRCKATDAHDVRIGDHR